MNTCNILRMNNVKERIGEIHDNKTTRKVHTSLTQSHHGLDKGLIVSMKKKRTRARNVQHTWREIHKRNVKYAAL